MLSFLPGRLFATVVGGVLFALASTLGACAAGSADLPNSTGGSSGTGGRGGIGGGGGTGGTTTGRTVAFSNRDTLPLGRGQTAELTVQVIPPGINTVRFALLPGPANTPPGDAALSATDQMTNFAGIATVTVTAPSAPTTFYVRASVEGGASDQRLVEVERTGLADLLVMPDYPEDGRPVQRWYATAQPNLTCATLPNGPLDDSLSWAVSETTPVAVRNVMAETQLAVVVRAERYAWGCTTIEAAVEGMANLVQVPVTDVPIQLAASEVSVSFDFADHAEAFGAALAPVGTALIGSLAVEGKDDVALLLDAMQEASDTTDFSSVRTAERWDAMVSAALGDAAPRMLRDPLERWFAAGPLAAAGPVTGTMAAFGDEPDGARLTLTDIAVEDPAALGFMEEADAVWYLAQGDKVVLGITLSFITSRFVVGSANLPAVAEIDDSTSLVSALATAIPCSTVATTLIDHGQVPTQSFAGCDFECTQNLCEEGLGVLLETLAARSQDAPSTIEIAATGEGSVGAEAELVGLEGDWVGTLTVDSQRTELAGGVEAPAP